VPQSIEPTTILASLDVGIIVQDRASTVLYANAAAQRLLGVSAVGRDSRDPAWRVVRTDGLPFEAESLPVFEAIRTGQPVRGVVMGIDRPQGDRVWLSVDAHPVRGASDMVDRIIISLTDITPELRQRLEAQDAAEQLDFELEKTRQQRDLSEATYQSVLRAMAEGVALHGLGGEILFANPSAERILGLTLAQMQGRHPMDSTWRLTDSRGEPLPPSAIPSEITRVSGRPQRNAILTVQRGDGTRGWLSVNTDPIGGADASGHCMVVATFTDITSERSALDAVESGRDRLARLTEALPGVVLEILVTPDGVLRIPFASAAVTSLGVQSPDELREWSALAECIAERDRERTLAAIRAAAQTTTALDLEIRMVWPSGIEHDTRLRTSAPTTVADGTLFRVILIDVSEQRRLERTLRETQRHEGLGLLAAGIAHNFNNMLAAIIPNLETLRDAVDGPLRAEAVDAHQAALAASELVRQLMLLTRREQGTAPSVVDLGEVADDVVRICRRTFDRRITVSLQAASERALVVGRRAELQQVILNLCLNARDAVEHRPSPQLDVTMLVDARDVRVTVRDNGMGMSEAVQQHLGDPFFTTKPPGLGTGLGIATVIGILRDAGGELQWRSTEGRGAEFTVRLPRATTYAAAETPVADAAPALVVRRPILLVDDEAIVRRSVARTLTRLGFDVTTAEDAREALRVLQARPEIVLVVADQNMPGMSGTELLEAIRSERPQLPFLIISGNAGAIAMQAPPMAVLAKPFAERQLSAEIERLLS
jgi:PAS domain S-box-containing protein